MKRLSTNERPAYQTPCIEDVQSLVGSLICTSASGSVEDYTEGTDYSDYFSY